MNWYQDRSCRVLRARLRSVIWLAVLALAGFVSGPVVAIAQQPAQQPGAGTALVFDGVTVIDVEQGKHILGQRVVIIGNRIKAMGDASKVSVPKGAQVVDAKGKYLIPGLWDMHTHPRRYTNSFYPLFIANGVTGIRDAGSEVPIDTLQLWRREILAGTRVGPPRQLLSGQSIAGPQPNCRRVATNNQPQTCIADSADARHYVDSLKAAGADMIKPRAVNQAMYYVIAAESRRLGIPFGGHIDGGEPPMDVSDSGAAIVDHMQIARNDHGIYGYCWTANSTANAEQCQPIADRFKRNGTWFVPTLTRYRLIGFQGFGLEAKALFTLLSKRASEFWQGTVPHGTWLHDSTRTDAAAGMQPPDSLGNMRILQRVGMPILAGTDAGAPVLTTMPPGFSLLTELAMYQAEGMTPLAVLQTATLNPAKFLHATDSLGTVAPGKLADLVLLDADPLTDITNTTTIRAVVANGRYFDRAALDQLLSHIQR